ncbi:N-glycosyltransferase [Thermoplasmatales archaeon]|nr:N-glycosyltransferase [Thermoplasmatales archaeon]
MQVWEIVSIISILFTIPVLMVSYYQLVLFYHSLRYPLDLEKDTPVLTDYPKVSILIASYNEKYVIDRCVDSVIATNYPKDKLQIVFADDSTDETVAIIDTAAQRAQKAGIESAIFRRPDRDNFKSGSMTLAMSLVTGVYVLQLDSDSRILEDTIIKGVHAFQTHPDASFVSFRVGHYNRYFNYITTLFAISQDQGDTISKMGSYLPNFPFSGQGGYIMYNCTDIRKVGLWSEHIEIDDAKISWNLYSAGTRGIYLSNARIMSEDPETLEIWKKRAYQIQKGWTKIASVYFKKTVHSKDISFRDKFVLFLTYLSPFTNLSWIITSFLSGFSLVFGWQAPSSSVFSNPLYVIIVSLPSVVFYLSAFYALKVQNIVTVKNLVMIPILTYASACMIILGAIAFIQGIFRKKTPYFKTPKTGDKKFMKSVDYNKELKIWKVSYLELAFSLVGLFLGAYSLYAGVWVLGLSMFGFSILTIKSLNLSRLFVRGHNGGGGQIPAKDREIAMQTFEAIESGSSGIR